MQPGAVHPHDETTSQRPLDPIPPPSANPYFAGRQPRGGGPDEEIPTDPSARPPSSFGPPNRHWASRSVDMFRDIAHVSL